MPRRGKPKLLESGYSWLKIAHSDREPAGEPVHLKHVHEYRVHAQNDSQSGNTWRKSPSQNVHGENPLHIGCHNESARNSNFVKRQKADLWREAGKSRSALFSNPWTRGKSPKLLHGAGQVTHSDVIVHGKAVKACDRDCKRLTPVVEQLNLDDSTSAIGYPAKASWCHNSRQKGLK